MLIAEENELPDEDRMTTALVKNYLDTPSAISLYWYWADYFNLTVFSEYY